MSTNATRLMSLREMETALANGSASKNEVLATLTARLSSANIADHKRQRTEAFKASVEAGKAGVGTANAIFASLREAQKPAAEAKKPAKPAKAKPAVAPKEPAKPAHDPMSTIAASLAELAKGQQVMIAFLQTLGPKPKASKAK